MICTQSTFSSLVLLLYNPRPVCLLARDMGDTSQGHLTVDGGPEIGTGGLNLCQIGLARGELVFACVARGLGLTDKPVLYCMARICQRVADKTHISYPSLSWSLLQPSVPYFSFSGPSMSSGADSHAMHSKDISSRIPGSEHMSPFVSIDCSGHAGRHENPLPPTPTYGT